MTMVLLVDDDQSHVQEVQDALDTPDDPYSVHHASRFRDALHYLRRHRRSVDAVVVSADMPGKDGGSMASFIKRTAARLPSVVIAHDADDVAAVEAIRWGAQDYVVREDAKRGGLRRSVMFAIERMKSRDRNDFISLASHQLRTPATGVKQYIGMVLEGFAGEVPPSVRPFLVKAYESNDRQLSIVNDLLQVAQLDAGTLKLHRRKTGLGSMLVNIVSEQSARFGQRGQHLEYRAPEQEVTIDADAERLRMVFDNLIDNAGKYTPEDKSVTVSLESQRDEAVISVEDEGVGIDAHDVDRIFEKFGRVENVRSEKVGGSGLGLYWAKQIVDLHDGSIEVESSPGAGSVFRVRLPVQQLQAVG